MLRKDREIKSLKEILIILDKCEVLRLGLSDNNIPYIVPMNFAYRKLEDKICIYMHCALKGKKLDIIKNNANVCFEVDCSNKIVNGNEISCNWSYEFESVIGNGIIELIYDNNKKIIALNAIMKKYGYEGMPIYTDNRLNGVAVLQINVSSISGKRNIT